MSTLTVSASTRNRLVSARGLLNGLIVFVPLAMLGEHLGFGAVFVFAAAAISCVPLSYWLGQATEALGTRLGPVSGGLLNATFGNAAELIISVIALNHGLHVVVRTSLIGSILGQLLLVLGTSLLLAGFKYGELRFSNSLVQINFTLMAIALVAIGLPTVLAATGGDSSPASITFLTPALAALLIVIYACAVFFSLHGQPSEENAVGEGPAWSSLTGLAVLAGSTAGMILVSELLVGSIEPFMAATGISQVFMGLILIPILSNVVDHIVAITVALKNRMDLSLTVSVGSAAQVASLVLPVIILVGFATGHATGLVFAPIELIALAVGLLLMVPVLLDGRSNWLEGAQLLTVYIMLAGVLWAL